MIRRAAVFGALFLVALSIAFLLSLIKWQPKISGSAEVLRSAGLKRAKDEGKQLFLLFTAPGCEWCARYDQYHADSDVSRVVDKHLVMLKMDVMETPGAMEMYQQYGGSGAVPEFSILDAHGMLLANSGEEGGKIGFPTTPQETESYFTALKTACPTLSDDEEQLLREKLAALKPGEES